MLQTKCPGHIDTCPPFLYYLCLSVGGNKNKMKIINQKPPPPTLDTHTRICTIYQTFQLAQSVSWFFSPALSQYVKGKYSSCHPTKYFQTKKTKMMSPLQIVCKIKKSYCGYTELTQYCHSYSLAGLVPVSHGKFH